MAVMIDGLIMRPALGDSAVDLAQLPRPDEIHGIEVFAGAATTPLKYGGMSAFDKTCGLSSGLDAVAPLTGGIGLAATQEVATALG